MKNATKFSILDIGIVNDYDIGEGHYGGLHEGDQLHLAISRERGKTSLLPNEIHNTMLTYKQSEFPLPVCQ